MAQGAKPGEGGELPGYKVIVRLTSFTAQYETRTEAELVVKTKITLSYDVDVWLGTLLLIESQLYRDIQCYSHLSDCHVELLRVYREIVE